MAITKDTFRTLIREGQEQILGIKLYDRPYQFEPNGRYVLVGVRQAGKSYMLYKRIKQLMNEGHRAEEIIYIDFDDERLIDMRAEDFDLIIQAYQSLYNYEPFFFFDEIQNVIGWEHFARRLANKKCRVFITGSNAKMLSRDIETTLGGRFLSSYVFPYSFAEYLGAQGITLTAQWQYGRERARVQQMFASYIKWGGFPELLLFQNKRKWLNDLYEKIVLGDIIQRNKIKNELSLRLTIKRIADNVMQPTSYRRIANLIKSTGMNIAVSSVSDYISYAQEAFVIFSLENYGAKFVEKETIKKHYFVDNGLLNIFLSNGDTSLLENVCAIHLYRRYGRQLYYYNKNIEVDFFLPELSTAIQTSYSIYGDGMNETFEREVNALKQIHSLYNLKHLLIVTYDEENIIPIDENTSIQVIPVWKWLLLP